MDLHHKNILFFSAQAFGYQNEIRAEMERMGAHVDYFDERPANSFVVKAMIRINRNLLARYIDRYHERIIEGTKDRKYDYVFFIKGESVSVANLEKIKNNIAQITALRQEKEQDVLDFEQKIESLNKEISELRIEIGVNEDKANQCLQITETLQTEINQGAEEKVDLRDR